MGSFESEAGAAALRERLRGEVLVRGDAGYDRARAVWNARFDRYPALVARCLGADDVAACIGFARERGLALAVKGGGHDYAGNSASDGGLLVDLSAMDAVEVDPDARIVRAGPGATWADIDAATQAHGLATPGATVSSVGVGGFTLGGGAGHLGRRHGLACDNLVAAEVVTADGSVLEVGAEAHPDLFWAIRGGGGNFGVATAFALRLHPVGPDVLAGQLVYKFEDAGAVLRHYRDFMAGAPDAIQCWAFLLRLPPDGTPVVDLVACHAGDLESAEADLAPLRAFGEPMMDTIAPVPYQALQQAFDAGMGEGQRWYSRGHYLPALGDAAIDTLLRHAGALPGEFTTVYLGAEGGAIGRVASDANAFPHRDASFSLHVFPGWKDPADDNDIMRWAREVHRAMAPHATGGVYVNMLADDERDRIGAAYDGNYERLLALKRQWDPDNLFRGNHNIRPGG